MQNAKQADEEEKEDEEETSKMIQTLHESINRKTKNTYCNG